MAAPTQHAVGGTADRPGEPRPVDHPRLAGIFSVTLPVSNLTAARAWYERVFDLRLIFEFPGDDGVVRGVAYEIPGLDTGSALCERPDVAGMSGFAR